MPDRFCPLVKCRAPLETVVDRAGRARTICPACERRRRHLCLDCDRRTTGKAWRCPVHLHEQRKRNDRIHHARHQEARREKDRKRWRRLTAEQREQRRQARRLRDKRHAGQKAERTKAWNASHRIWYLAYHRRYNRRPGRAAAKRAQAMQRYRELHPKPDPRCAVCGAGVPWDGRGRPKGLCPPHQAVVYPARRKPRQGPDTP